MSFKQIKLGEVIKQRKGFITIDDNKEYKLCRVQLHRRGVVLREIVRGNVIKTKKQQVCKAGDFLVAEMDAKVGGYGFVPKDLDGAIVSSHYFLFELDENKIRPKYLEVISKLQILQDQIKAVGSTNYAAIRPASVLNWDIPITTISKQKEIEKLFDATTAIGNNLSIEFIKQHDLLAQLRQSLLREAMQGKLVKQDLNDGNAKDLLKKIKIEKVKSGKKEKELPLIKPEEIPFKIPENWAWCRLGEIAEIVRGKGPKYSERGVTKMLNQKCVRWFVVDTQFAKAIDEKWYSEISSTYIVRKSDVLVNSTGDGTIGRCAIADNLATNYIFDSHILNVRSSINQKFICYLINSDYGQRLIDKAKGATSTKQTELGVGNLSNFVFPLPPLSHQNRIVLRLDELMKLCEELQKSISLSRDQNELLLQQVLKEALTN